MHGNGCERAVREVCAKRSIQLRLVLTPFSTFCQFLSMHGGRWPLGRCLRDRLGSQLVQFWYVAHLPSSSNTGAANASGCREWLVSGRCPLGAVQWMRGCNAVGMQCSVCKAVGAVQ